MGNPTKFKPAYCQEAIECLSLGHSIAGFAGHIGVATSSVYKWVKDFPDFGAAMQVATAKAILYWEQQLIKCAETGKGNVTAIIFGLKNRAHEEWRDVQKIEHGKPGEFDGLDADQRDAIRRAIESLAAAAGNSSEGAGPDRQPGPPKPVSPLH